MTDILIVNDDGINAIALKLIKKKLGSLGNITIVAPETPQNATGNSLTLHKPLRVRQVGENEFTTSGTPADCTRIGVLTVLKDNVDLVISGINDGANLGDDIYYSGTVAGAREAALLGIPAIASSLVTGKDKNKNFDTAVNITFKLAKKVLQNSLPKRKLLNLNVPNLPDEEIQGIKITRLGIRIYDRKVREREDPLGRKYYWILGDKLSGYRNKGTDLKAIDNKFATITPLTMDSTDYNLSEEISNWEINSI
ncbi:MAG: 5'/3'-nucleotidase SurE [Elusimicrobiota bacterium]